MLIFIHAHLRNTTLGANNSNWISTLPSHLTLQNKNKKKELFHWFTTIKSATVHSLLTDTLVSRQLYLDTFYLCIYTFPQVDSLLYAEVDTFWKWKLDFSFVYALS